MRSFHINGYAEADIHYFPSATLPAVGGRLLGSVRIDGIGIFPAFCARQLGTCLHKTVIRLPLLGKAVLVLAVIYLVIQMKSSEIQPFIYFQF